MSKSNENNRPELGLYVGAVSATTELVLLKAHKKMAIQKCELIDSAIVAASGTNYVEAQLSVDGVAVGTAVDTQAGLAALAGLEVELGGDELVLEAGEVLSLTLTVAASGALTQASVSLDSIVRGS